MVRASARRRGDAATYAQASVLLAESEEAQGDRRAALRALLEGREALKHAGGEAATKPIDRAIDVFRNDWGEEFDHLLAALGSG